MHLAPSVHFRSKPAKTGVCCTRPGASGVDPSSSAYSGLGMRALILSCAWGQTSGGHPSAARPHSQSIIDDEGLGHSVPHAAAMCRERGTSVCIEFELRRCELVNSTGTHRITGLSEPSALPCNAITMSLKQQDMRRQKVRTFAILERFPADVSQGGFTRAC